MRPELGRPYRLKRSSLRCKAGTGGLENDEFSSAPVSDEQARGDSIDESWELRARAGVEGKVLLDMISSHLSSTKFASVVDTECQTAD